MKPKSHPEVIAYVRDRLRKVADVGPGCVSEPDKDHVVRVLLLGAGGIKAMLFLSGAYRLAEFGGGWQAAVDVEIKRQMRLERV